MAVGALFRRAELRLKVQAMVSSARLREQNVLGTHFTGRRVLQNAGMAYEALLVAQLARIGMEIDEILWRDVCTGCMTDRRGGGQCSREQQLDQNSHKTACGHYFLLRWIPRKPDSAG